MAVDKIFHANCPKAEPHPEDNQPEWPEMVWGGFSMARMADYECPKCGMSVMVCEE